MVERGREPDDDGPARPTRDLLERALERDFEAERRLFDRFRELLLRELAQSASARRLGPAAHAEDVVQEVWRRALAAGLLTRFEDRGPGSLERALKQVLEYTLADWARRRAAEKRGGRLLQYSLERELPEGERPASDVSPVPTPTAAARCAELLLLCRAELDEREWRAWRAVELEGRSTSEAATALGCTPAAVRGLLFRSRAKLAAALGGAREPRAAE